MRKVRLLAVVALLGLTTACSSILPQNPIRAGATNAGDQEASDGVLDALADGIIQADTLEGRKLRVCFFAMAVSEAYTFRLTYYGADIDQKRIAYSAISGLANTVAKLRAADGGLFARTDMFYVSVDLIRAVEGPLRDRALSAIGDAATWNWRGLARGLREGVGQGWLISAMIADAKAAAELYDAGELSSEAAWQACEGRIALNQQVLSAAIGIPAPQELRIVPGG